MIIIAADNLRPRLEQLQDCLQRVFPDDEIVSFVDPMLAVKYSLHNKVDMAFTAINMRHINGYELAEGIYRFNPDVRVFYIKDESEVSNDTGLLNDLTLPVTPEKLKNII